MKESHSWLNLRKHRCLLVLDDVETILRNGDRIWRYNEDTKVMGTPEAGGRRTASKLLGGERSRET